MHLTHPPRFAESVRLVEDNGKEEKKNKETRIQ